MKTKRLNGTLFEKMLRNGLANLRAREQEINDLNVFPVADGDTGTNMCLTVENAVSTAAAKTELCFYLKDLCEGMLLGARGNSGVILSQFFKGAYLELQRCAAATPGDLRNALVRAYKVAYASVARPAEGTILTVTREAAEHIRTQVNRSTTIETLLAMYIAEMRKTLAATPDMLPVLKEAGVVDSGALGFITLVEGMLKYLYGETLELADVPARPAPAASGEVLFDENSAFEEGYCMEFVLQLMRSGDYDQHFRIESFTDDLRDLGSSLVAVLDGKRVKIHIHTKKPARIIQMAQEYGEFISFKLENMQLQHNEHLARTAKKPLATVAVVSGEGTAKLFREFGCDSVIDGGATMNPSPQDFVGAFSGLSAELIAVLPDNKNVIPAAEQAAELSGRRVVVLPSKSIAEGYCALAMDLPDTPDPEYRVSQMRRGLESVVTVAQTTASRDFSFHDVSCRKGDEIALADGELVCVS
ncbi:MAG: DAK2 domain-containing protein, partial [Oscillospiraceae bacterium]|nr:DAK2 domain-containing protein [Oscillospiraceae bacterium]